MSRLLVVVENSELARSLEFALRAEGHEVELRRGVVAGQSVRVDCTVLDHHAAGDTLEEGSAFCRAHRPVILLANALPHPLSQWAFRTVLKPLLGAALIEAVREATMAAAAPD